MAEANKMSREQYMALLQSRMDEYMKNNPQAAGATGWASQPLLEWFIMDGDEDLIEG